MTFALVSSKGGAGKTTGALHLAAALARRRGARVVLMDADANLSATGWAKRGDGLPFDVRPWRAVTTDADHVVIDTAGGEHPADLLDLARITDRVVIAAQPLALDLLAALATYRQLAPRAPAAVLLGICPPAPSRATAEARAWLADHGVPVLRQHVPRRAAYAHAALTGTLAWDHRGGHDQRDAWARIAREVTA